MDWRQVWFYFIPIMTFMIGEQLFWRSIGNNQRNIDRISSSQAESAVLELPFVTFNASPASFYYNSSISSLAFTISNLRPLSLVSTSYFSSSLSSFFFASNYFLIFCILLFLGFAWHFLVGEASVANSCWGIPLQQAVPILCLLQYNYTSILHSQP